MAESVKDQQEGEDGSGEHTQVTAVQNVGELLGEDSPDEHTQQIDSAALLELQQERELGGAGDEPEERTAEHEAPGPDDA